MKYLIALIGEAGAGKDRVLNEVMERMPSLHKKISYTTRPPRDYEIEGKDYYFVGPDDMMALILQGDMLEVAEFNNWFYGTGKESLAEDKVNIGIFSPHGIESLLEYNKKEIDMYVFYITADDKVRWMRQLNREEEPDIDEIYRRWKADMIDFDELPFQYNECPNNDEYDLDANWDSIVRAAKLLEDRL